MTDKFHQLGDGSDIEDDGSGEDYPDGPYHYRLYTKDHVYLRECHADTYDEAKEKLQADDEQHNIFSVQHDNHEIICGIEWWRRTNH